MYDMLMAQVDGGGHALSDLVPRIDEAWAGGHIDDAQREELLTRAREVARPQDQWASTEDRVEALETALRDLVSRVAALESGQGEGGPSTASESPEEWRQPLGAFDAYDLGALVTFGGKVWRSVIPANVWSPATYPQGWEMVA